jgi:tetratricopeptide (TPR) repeat protein
MTTNKNSVDNNDLSEKEKRLFSGIERAISEKEVIDFELKLKNTFGGRKIVKPTFLNIAAVLITVSIIVSVVWYFGYPSNDMLFGQYYEPFLAENTSGFSRGDYELKSIALIYHAEGNYESAIPAFLELLKIQPEDYEARFLLGISYIETGKYNEALKLFNQIKDSPPNFYTDDALWYAALVELKLSNFQSSRNLFLQIEQSSEYWLPAQKLLEKVKSK